jgi:hypothetical protein
MALIKPLLTPQRAVAAYHKISNVEVNAAHGTITFTITNYVDAIARDANLPIWTTYKVYPLSRFETDIRAIGYAILKSDPESEFADAEGDAPAPASMAVEFKTQIAEVAISEPEVAVVEMPLPPLQ